MTVHIQIKGRAITNPVARAVVGALTLMVVGALAAVVIFLVLPVVGIVVTLTVGLVGVILVALGIGVPVLILGGSLLGALLAAVAAVRDGRTKS